MFGLTPCLFIKSIDHRELPRFNNLLNFYPIQRRHEYAMTSEVLPEAEQMRLAEGPSNMATEGIPLDVGSIHPATPRTEIRKALDLPCYLLDKPYANEYFCGREDILERLAVELLPSKTVDTALGTGLWQFALCGFGGVGKTEIAREFCRRYKACFDAVFWDLADEIANLDHRYQQIALALGLEDSSECKSQFASRETVRGWLSKPRKQTLESNELGQVSQDDSEANWLLIFDNADDITILEDYWPQGNGSILITSRNPSAKSLLTQRPSGLDLGPLSRKDSIILFNHLVTVSDELEGTTTRQTCTPLAISQMAGIIRRQDLALSKCLELYEDHEEHASLYESNFYTNMVTYSQIRQLLELITFFDPDVIQEEALMKASMYMNGEGIHYNKSNYIEARSDLLQSSIIQRDEEKQQLSTHRVVQNLMLILMDFSRKSFMFDNVVRILWAVWPSAMPQPSKEPDLPKPKSSGGRLLIERWPICAAIYPHVLRLHQLWPGIANPSEATSLLFAKLLTEAAWYQKERGQTRHFDGFFETAQNICDSSTHPDRDSLLADIHFCLGSIAMDTNDFNTSRSHKERSLDIVSKICKDLNTADEKLYLAYAERGVSRIQDKRYEEGEADLKEALRIRKALGNYVPRSAEAHLSHALLAQGKLEECDTLLLDSLAGREKALGRDDQESIRTGLILYALGSLRAKQNQWDESFTYHQRAWQHMRATVGEKDIYAINAAHKVAEHHFRLGDNQNAIAIITRALSTLSVDQIAHKNQIARTSFLEGKVYEAMGEKHEASHPFRVAYWFRKEITNEDRDIKSLTMDDFDEIVAFWAR
ncbi:tetratricopeptide repeat domain-containing protein [Aspergillus sclerotioniger CBS 115572]|uniref:Tetratricopeptide repeat domain-containing protein n=1 Tax=Aspergillus sclerotioniger CBS 115572 TaxID=1450535 RepID=A0A317WZW1_9EURO|nr:tetratricopeptide repeat domain-containing protein [Aspergillus sclerotioniger CBS 115572]PWY91909.1 tetratricopeptide repeat domain-containing protein [Aspergillus sclerotioniger CBS 115572]